MENNENKNNKGLLILIVVFSLIVLGLGGWMVYDKVTSGKEEPTQEENSNNQEKQSEEDIGEIDAQLAKIKKEYPKSNDSTVTGDNVYDYLKDGGHQEKLTFYYNNYKIIYDYIDGAGDESQIKIYDKYNKQVYFNGNIKTYIIDDEYITYLPTIANGKLHILSYNPKKCYIDDFEEMWPYLEYKQIDISADDIIREETIVSLKYTVEGSSYCE